MTKRSLFHFSHCTWWATNLACSSPSQACGHELIVYVMSWAASTKLVQGHARVTHKLSFYEPGGWADELLCTFATSKLILSTSSPTTSHSLKIVTYLLFIFLFLSLTSKNRPPLTFHTISFFKTSSSGYGFGVVYSSSDLLSRIFWMVFVGSLQIVMVVVSSFFQSDPICLARVLA